MESVKQRSVRPEDVEQENIKGVTGDIPRESIGGGVYWCVVNVSR